MRTNLLKDKNQTTLFLSILILFAYVIAPFLSFMSQFLEGGDMHDMVDIAKWKRGKNANKFVE